jgi:hypothetical protein
VLYATITSTFYVYTCEFRLPSRLRNGTEIETKKGAGSQPRFVEKFTSRLEINGKGWFSASHVEQETGPFDQCVFAFERTMHSRLFYLLIFSSILSQQLAKSV